MYSNVSKSGSRFRGDERSTLMRPRSQLSNSVLRSPKAKKQKKIVPCLRLWARGAPSFLSSVSLEGRGGWRADKAQCPDYSGRGVRLTPDVGCTFVHPRLAARQRGILAFMPLTVVGPGRLLVAGEAARVRPGDEGCVNSFARRCRSRSPPTERLRKAPLEEWIGMAYT